MPLILLRCLSFAKFQDKFTFSSWNINSVRGKLMCSFKTTKFKASLISRKCLTAEWGMHFGIQLSKALHFGNIIEPRQEDQRVAFATILLKLKTKTEDWNLDLISTFINWGATSSKHQPIVHARKLHLWITKHSLWILQEFGENLDLYWR